MIEKYEMKEKDEVRIKTPDICAVILAAGLSSRMGEFKPLLDIGGKSALERLSDSIREAGVTDIFAVTGYEREKLSGVLAEKGIKELFNPDHEQGMLTSVKRGISEAEDRNKYDGLLLFPVDVPLVSEVTIKKVAASFDKRNLSVATYRGKKGHPLLIPRDFFREILDYTGANGLAGATRKYDIDMTRVESEDEGAVLDMDTPERYREILRHYDSPEADRRYRFRGRLYLVRHGMTKQHDAKIYMGQSDIPLNEEGREEILAAVDKLKDEDIKVDHIYASDRSRCTESAEIIRNRLYPDVPIITAPELREISLGDWEGQYIEDIKKELPGEYKKRGENILLYKRPGGENTYDLRYRVSKKLYQILNSEGEGDVLIVAHRGVISAIIAELRQTDWEEAWGLRILRGSVEKFELNQ